MRILIEHNGTPEVLKVVEEIKEFIEDEFNGTVETVTGAEDSPVILYNNLSKLVEFNRTPNMVELHFYLSTAEEDY